MRINDFNEKFQKQLFDLLRFETYKPDQKKACAEFLQDFLISVGLEVKLFENNSAPIIVAKTRDECSKRILLYSHYDVKPPGNLKKWETVPFEPTIKNNRIYCRGSGDAKGQLFIALKVAELFMKDEMDNSDVGLTLLFEGEEESDSIFLEEFCETNKEYLESQLVLILDSHWYFDEPVIAYGTRGQISFYLSAYEKKQHGCLHAGNYGGLFQGANYKMVKALSECFENGNIAIPGFYDEISKKDYGVFGPSFTICSIEGGDMSRSLIPDSCRSQIDIRIVKDQVPSKILELIRKHFDKYEIKLELRQISKPALSNIDNRQIELLALSIEHVTQKKPIIMSYLGAYVPIEKLMKLNVPVYVLPFAQSSENNHAPNENILIDNIFIGIDCIRKFIELYR